jgi:hypothetical protein
VRNGHAPSPVAEAAHSANQIGVDSAWTATLSRDLSDCPLPRVGSETRSQAGHSGNGAYHSQEHGEHLGYTISQREQLNFELDINLRSDPKLQPPLRFLRSWRSRICPHQTLPRVL